MYLAWILESPEFKRYSLDYCKNLRMRCCHHSESSGKHKFMQLQMRMRHVTLKRTVAAGASSPDSMIQAGYTINLLGYSKAQTVVPE